MIKKILFFITLFLGLISCLQDDNKSFNLEGFWKVQGEYTEDSINTLEWNIINSRILHFTIDGVEFLKGLQYFPTRHFGFISPYKVLGDKLFIFYEPEGRYIEFLVKVYSNDSIIVSRGSLDIPLKLMNLKEEFDTIDLGSIKSVELSVRYDSLSNQENLIAYDVVVNLLNKMVYSKRQNRGKVIKQITPFETTYLLEQIKRINFLHNKYDSIKSDIASYTIKIETANQLILLELGDNTNTPPFVGGLVKFLDYLGKSN